MEENRCEAVTTNSELHFKGTIRGVVVGKFKKNVIKKFGFHTPF